MSMHDLLEGVRMMAQAMRAFGEQNTEAGTRSLADAEQRLQGAAGLEGVLGSLQSSASRVPELEASFRSMERRLQDGGEDGAIAGNFRQSGSRTDAPIFKKGSTRLQDF
mmetsp:Transcript_102302/g.234584  ORF Transcript_102302/g.234584 Transcript_102302/m.234584 type:complete len:109 (-) Transcript_102302:835-1161(-)